eukprot:TRINITY_DN270_c0_g1_i1.p1 TRINITY_DN270_c0_g1~~TRINITY_DN270_c0_g1_i1.p1  ORF type:complete len:512 (-),score=125.97 TRINITY_DN270_c0_g1_i1:169-1704(-)
MKALSCVVFVLLLSCVAVATLPEDILKSHFDGRSGDILIRNKQSNANLGSVSFINAQKFPEAKTAIPETEVADIITHFNGLSPFQPNRDRTNFPPANFFSKPKANVFFYVQNPSSFPLESLPNSQTFPLSRESYSSSASSLSQLTTLFSGVSPSVHGIVSDNFVDRTPNSPSSHVSHAYGSWTQGVSYSANLADLWTVNFQGKALVLSFSDSYLVSRALSAKPVVLENTISANYGYYLAKDKIATVYDNVNKLPINKEHIKTFYSNNAPCGLSFDDATDFNLIAEIAIPQLLIQALTVPGSEMARFTRDNIPDLFSFGFSSLKNFGAKHGLESDAMKCAVNSVDKSIAAVIAAVNQIYGQNVLAEVATINVQSAVEPVAVVKSTLKSLVEGNRTVGLLMPNVYLTQRLSADRLERIVDNLNKALENTGFEAVTMPEPHFEEHYVAYRLVEAKRAAANNTMTNAGLLHTCLWTGVGLGAALFGGAYFMFSIDASNDPELYKMDINQGITHKL